MDRYNTVIPNLARRDDRWYTCLGALLALDYNPNRLYRFSAHDGNEYESYEHARDTAAQQFPESRYICDNRMAKYYYCWSWTWYDIMTRIADREYGSRVLLLVDDWAPRFSYPDIVVQLHILDAISPIKCVQLATSTRPPPGFSRDDNKPPGDKIDGTPFRHHINLSGDFGNVMSPQGAQEILDVANSRSNILTPDCVFFWVARTIGTSPGYYCMHSFSTRVLNRNKHINCFEDGRQEDHTPH